MYYSEGEKRKIPIRIAALAILAASILISCILAADPDDSSATNPTSGSCGASLEWEIDPDTGNLTITGTGDMNNFSSYETRWGGYTVRSVSLPDGITGIGNYAFYRCDKLTAIDIPGGVEIIGVYAFGNCSSLTSITIPNSVTDLCGNAFCYCSSLETVTLGDNLTKIHNETFRNCSKLTSITIPDSVTEIGYAAFSGTGLETVSISANVSSIEDEAFSIKTLRSITVDGSNTHYCSVDGVLFDKDKETLLAYPAKKTGTEYTVPATVTTIEYGAFEFNSELASVTIPDNVGSIGNSAFWEAKGLTSVTIGSGVGYIGSYAFDGCTNLSSFTVSGSNTYLSSADGVLFDKGKEALLMYPANKADTAYTVPDTVKYIEYRAFYQCANLTSVTISDNVEEIGDYAFCECKKLTTATIGSGVLEIGTYAFWSSGLTSIVIPDNVTNIGHRSFEDCTSLTSASLGSGLTSIENRLFCGCSELTSITIPDNVIRIEYEAFVGCSKATTLTIGAKVIYICDNALQALSSLESVTVDGSNTAYCSVDGVLFDKERTTLLLYPANKSGTTYSIPDTVTTVANYSFIGCHNLATLTIPDGVETLSTYSITECPALSSVTVGSGVNSIGINVFKICPNLASVSVSETNTAYCSVDDVLFNKDRTVLMVYPAKKTGTSYSIPDTVTTINHHSFRDSKELTSIEIPASVTAISGYPFYNCSNLTSITVDDSNTAYCSVDGVLFDKDRTVLMVYPAMKAGTEYSIPGTVLTILDGSFYECRWLESVTIPDSTLTIGNQAFYGCRNLASVNAGSGLTAIGSAAFSSDFNLESFTVDGSNESFTSIDGALYSKDETALILVPPKAGGVLKIPNNTGLEVTSYLPFCTELTGFQLEDGSMYNIRNGALFINDYLISYPAKRDADSFTFGADEELISESLPYFMNAENLKEIRVADGNENLSSVDGALYDKDGRTLFTCPAGKTSYSLPATTTGTTLAAFTGNVLEEVRFVSGTDMTVVPSTFLNCGSLKKIVIEEGADVTFELDSIIFDDEEEHTIYVVAPEGFTIDTTGYASNISIVYGEPPSPNDGQDNTVIFIVIGVVGGVVIIGIAVFLIRRH